MSISFQNICHTNHGEACLLRLLTKEEILSIYSTHSVRHFPKDERKPISSIERMFEEGIYIGYGLFFKKQPETLLCYGFFTALPNQGAILLDYFAVLEEYRNLGIGSVFLSHMKNFATEYDGFLIESEDPDFATDEEERIIRNKRLAFYSRNKADFTGIRAEVFGVHYRLLYFPIAGQPDTNALASYFCNLYRHMISPQHYQADFRLFLPESESNT